ncbi:hypothetical protein SAMN05421678_11857 [Actinopolymorpha cephalotaxi]|uniref:Phosphoglycerol transferase MdoB n=1 Tax=Actinopolymorpha cephalotaxi TaxID=504797 RepID=A0A1I3A5I8_9ACTN|nr:hypothetical protein SAMN05421678_11857 [Actinopolymorpha cephalotaxi]
MRKGTGLSIFVRTRRAAGWTTSALAALLVLGCLLLPRHLWELRPTTFVRIPLEAIFGAALLLALPRKGRRVAAMLAGVGLGLLTLVKLLDMGFDAVLQRSFNPVLDWGLFADAVGFVRDTAGDAAAVGAVVAAVLLALGIPTVLALAMVRLVDLPAGHRTAATRTALVLGTAWMVCVMAGVQVAGAPVATVSAAELVHSRAHLVVATLRDEQAFAREASVDSYAAHTPPDRMLTALRGKDVIFAFVESYGRVAVEDPQISPRVDATLAEGTKRLRAAGFSSRSAFLTSSTTGADSWLAHSTFMSGLWINNQQRYRTVTASSDRLTLTGAFQRTGAWRDVGVLPGTTRAWPDGKFYHFDKLYDAKSLGYKGPAFSWSTMPDQYTLSAFERLEHGRKHRGPLMAEVVLTSSHNPWAPLPSMVGWDEVGDGSVYDAIHKVGRNPKQVWKNADQVRTEYARSIGYSLTSLLTYVEKYGDKNTVLVFLGDHQPNPTVTRHSSNRDVPIAIVAHDPAVMARISHWGWQNGLDPSPTAPVWRMDTFRSRFLTAYGSGSGPGLAAAPARPAH